MKTVERRLLYTTHHARGVTLVVASWLTATVAPVVVGVVLGGVVGQLGPYISGLIGLLGGFVATRFQDKRDERLRERLLGRGRAGRAKVRSVKRLPIPLSFFRARVLRLHVRVPDGDDFEARHIVFGSESDERFHLRFHGKKVDVRQDLADRRRLVLQWRSLL